MPFNSESGKNAGKLSKRGNALPMELRQGLYQLIDTIINDLDYKGLTTSQRIKLLDVALRHSLPRLSYQKTVEGFEQPVQIEFGVTDDEGNTKVYKPKLDENFSFKDLLKDE